MGRKAEYTKRLPAWINPVPSAPWLYQALSQLYDFWSIRFVEKPKLGSSGEVIWGWFIAAIGQMKISGLVEEGWPGSVECPVRYELMSPGGNHHDDWVEIEIALKLPLMSHWARVGYYFWISIKSVPKGHDIHMVPMVEDSLQRAMNRWTIHWGESVPETTGSNRTDALFGRKFGHNLYPNYLYL